MNRINFAGCSNDYVTHKVSHLFSLKLEKPSGQQESSICHKLPSTLIMYSRAISASQTPLTYNAIARHRLPGVSVLGRVSQRNFSSTAFKPSGGGKSPPSSATGNIVVDQTKINNDPNKEKKEEHVKAGNKASSAEGRDHPAKQPDPQKPPERSTGFETEGPDGNSGEGEDSGHVHKQEKPPLTE
ncbi:hypothetical protein PV04_10478 [Phialophora macrospora]|uniref:Uncharacterized protein n=1 Tax=Phialophora macrospora TaxID=1851006 RepID=A0A0D2FQK7_9EURO|nr:hypothetical protein PV04_10478 [Phialophora macrospora]